MKLTAVHKEIVSIAVGFVALGCSVAALASEIVIVGQQGRQFSTQSVDLKAGDTIRFTNDDPFVHQLYVRSPSFSFSSDAQPRGMILPVPFPVAGTFEVRCEIHPRMVLTVNVS
jgi:plastocyanin